MLYEAFWDYFNFILCFFCFETKYVYPEFSNVDHDNTSFRMKIINIIWVITNKFFLVEKILGYLFHAISISTWFRLNFQNKNCVGLNLKAKCYCNNYPTRKHYCKSVNLIFKKSVLISHNIKKYIYKHEKSCNYVT